MAGQTSCPWPLSRTLVRSKCLPAFKYEKNWQIAVLSGEEILKRITCRDSMWHSLTIVSTSVICESCLHKHANQETARIGLFDLCVATACALCSLQPPGWWSERVQLRDQETKENPKRLAGWKMNKNDENYESNTSIDCMPDVQAGKIMENPYFHPFSLTFTDVSRPTAWSPNSEKVKIKHVQRQGDFAAVFSRWKGGFGSMGCWWLHWLYMFWSLVQGTALHEAHFGLWFVLIQDTTRSEVRRRGAPWFVDMVWQACRNGHVDVVTWMQRVWEVWWRYDYACHAKTSCKVRLLLLRGGLSHRVAL